MDVHDEIVAASQLLDKDEMLKKYTLHSGLYYHNHAIVVPETADRVKQEIIRLHHDEAGHRGMTITERSIRQKFYWPLLQKDVREYVARCNICQRIKSRNYRKSQPLLSLPIPEDRWNEIEIDFITGLPSSGEHKYNAIATIVDRLTKEIFLIATHNTVSAEQFARLFFEQVWRFKGFPRTIYTDRDSKFMSDFWKKLMTLVNIDHRTGAPYHHQTTGLVEKANQRVPLANFIEWHSSG